MLSPSAQQYLDAQPTVALCPWCQTLDAGGQAAAAVEEAGGHEVLAAGQVAELAAAPVDGYSIGVAGVLCLADQV